MLIALNNISREESKMKDFLPHGISSKGLVSELGEFEQLLQSSEEFGEKELQTFFRKSLNLTVFLGSYVAENLRPNIYAFEYNLFDDYVCDLVVGHTKNNSYLFIEFEDARRNSIFEKKKTKVTLEYAKRLEHGFSQLVDWFEILSDMQNTNTYESRFGSKHATYHGMLVIGRDRFLEEKERRRLKWRSENVQINGKQIICVTYDMILSQLKKKLEVIQMLNKSDNSLD